jgi:hypothetical protein
MEGYKTCRIGSGICGVRFTRFLALCVCFVDRCLYFCPFSFGHCVVFSSWIHGFWLPLWYLLAIVLCTKPGEWAVMCVEDIDVTFVPRIFPLILELCWRCGNFCFSFYHIIIKLTCNKVASHQKFVRKVSSLSEVNQGLCIDANLCWPVICCFKMRNDKSLCCTVHWVL